MKYLYLALAFNLFSIAGVLADSWEGCTSQLSARVGKATEVIKCQGLKAHVLPSTLVDKYTVQVTVSANGARQTMTKELDGALLDDLLSNLKETLGKDYYFQGVKIEEASLIEFSIPKDTPLYDGPEEKAKPRVLGSDEYIAGMTCLNQPGLASIQFAEKCEWRDTQGYGQMFIAKKEDGIPPGLYIFSNGGHKFVPLSEKESQEFKAHVNQDPFMKDLEASNRIPKYPQTDIAVKKFFSNQVAKVLSLTKKGNFQTKEKLNWWENKIGDLMENCKTAASYDPEFSSGFSAEADVIQKSWSGKTNSKIIPGVKQQ